MPEDYVIETRGLGKRYGRRVAVENLDIAVPAGVVAGFIGPNGAGKTTTMAMLLGLVAPSEGTALILGQPIEEPSTYLGEVGALIERPTLYPGLTGEENLRLLATVGRHEDADIPGLLRLVGLEGRGGDRFAGYSMGMKQRLGIAAALLGDPALLILDEPTNGLDPAGIREMRQLIGDLADGGRTVFVSSHVLSELEQVCDYFVIIDKGSLVFQGMAGELVSGTSASIAVRPEKNADLDRLEQVLAAAGHTPSARNGHLVLRVDSIDPRAVAADLNRAAAAAGITLSELNTERVNLEERYLELVNGGGY